jgi:hypothetical protein
MADLILRPTGLPENVNKPWALQLRYHESVGETEYKTLCRVDDETAQEIMKAGKAEWLFGEPDWSERAVSRKHEEARQLRQRAEELES